MELIEEKAQHLLTSYHGVIVNVRFLDEARACQMAARLPRGRSIRAA